MWTWDEEALAAEAAVLKPEASALLKSPLGDDRQEDDALEQVLRIAPKASDVLTATRSRLKTLQAFASVASLHELLVRSSFNTDDKRANHDIHDLSFKLEALAGRDWAVRCMILKLLSWLLRL